MAWVRAAGTSATWSRWWPSSQPRAAMPASVAAAQEVVGPVGAAAAGSKPLVQLDRPGLLEQVDHGRCCRSRGRAGCRRRPGRRPARSPARSAPHRQQPADHPERPVVGPPPRTVSRWLRPPPPVRSSRGPGRATRPRGCRPGRARSRPAGRSSPELLPQPVPARAHTSLTACPGRAPHAAGVEFRGGLAGNPAALPRTSSRHHEFTSDYQCSASCNDGLNADGSGRTARSGERAPPVRMQGGTDTLGFF